jgi:hypothetical protein
MLFPSADAKKRDHAARQLDGSVVTKKLARAGRVTTVEGVARFVDANRRPHYFDVEWQDGTVEQRVSITKVKNRLKPSAAATALLAYEPLPDHWDLTCVDGVSAAVSRLMPGSWQRAHLTRLANAFKHAHDRAHIAALPPPLTPTGENEVHALAAFLDLSQLSTAVDPWTGTGTIARLLGQRGMHVRTNDIAFVHKAHTHADALQPAFYRAASSKMGIDAIITSPWFTALDIALPLAVLASRVVACMHVPGHYVTDAHPARADYLRGLMREGRLHLLWNLPRGPMGRRCGWLIVFAHASLRKLLIKPERRLSAPFSLAH